MPRRRPNPAYFIVAGILLTMVALGAGMVIEDDGAASEPPPIDERLLATAVPPTAAPAPEPTPEPTAVPEPTPIPDRTVCAQIAGTAYRSDTERAWFLANCFLTVLPSSSDSPSPLAERGLGGEVLGFPLSVDGEGARG